MVFSIIDDSDTVMPKFAQCNNCGVIHKVYDICKSEILSGKDEIRTVCTIDDISLTIPEDIRNVLESYQVDLPIWEHVQFILRNKLWGEQVVLLRDELDKEIQGKLLIIDGMGAGEVRIESFIRESWVELRNG